MAISSPLSTAANNIVKLGNRSERALPKAQREFQDFSKFLEIEIIKLQRNQLPDKRKVKNLANIDITNNFGSVGNLLKNLLGGLDIANFISGMFPGKGEKIGKSPAKGKAQPKPTTSGGKLKIGGLRALGITNAIFAGLDFATGLAEGESVGKAGAGAAGSFGGALAGSLLAGAIGQALIPVPGVGFVLGMVGGAAGGFLGGYGADRAYEAVSGEGKQEQRIKEQEQKQKSVITKTGTSTLSFSEVLMKFNEAVTKFEDFASGIASTMGSTYDDGEEDILEYGEYPERDPGDFQSGTMPELEAEGGVQPSSKMNSGYRTNERPNHMGTDYAMPLGTPISVIQPGKVTRAGWFDGYGYGVQINHPGGVNSFYGHLSSINVSLGQNIEPGTVIGKVGSTGRSTGPHLHFEVDANGQSKVNPTNYADKIFRFGGNVKAKQKQQPPQQSQVSNQQSQPSLSPSQQSQTSLSQSQSPQQTSRTQQTPITQVLPQNVMSAIQKPQRQIQTYPSYSQGQSYIMERQTIITTDGMGNRQQSPAVIPVGGGGSGQSVVITPQVGSAVLNSLMKSILLTSLSST